MPRYAVLRHETPPGLQRPVHFDLMLEAGGALRTWACPELPAAGRGMWAEQLADHRREYLDYEGEVSGGRGSVQRVAAGEFEVLEETNDLLRVRLTGDLAGELTLVGSSCREEPEPQKTQATAQVAERNYRWWISLSSG